MRHEWNWFVLGNKFLADFECAIYGCARHKGNDVLVFLGPAFSFTHAVVATRIFDIMWKPKKHWCCIKIVSNIEKTVQCNSRSRDRQAIYVNLDKDIIYTLYEISSWKRLHLQSLDKFFSRYSRTSLVEQPLIGWVERHT